MRTSDRHTSHANPGPDVNSIDLPTPLADLLRGIVIHGGFAQSGLGRSRMGHTGQLRALANLGLVENNYPTSWIPTELGKAWAYAHPGRSLTGDRILSSGKIVTAKTTEALLKTMSERTGKRCILVAYGPKGIKAQVHCVDDNGIEEIITVKIDEVVPNPTSTRALRQSATRIANGR